VTGKLFNRNIPDALERIWKRDGGHCHGVVSGFIGSRLVMNHLKIIIRMPDVLQAVLQPVACNEEADVLCMHYHIKAYPVISATHH
jgi:hypothetical protein